MNRNSKIFIGLAIFLFCCAISFKFTFGNGGVSAVFTFADMITLIMGFLAAAVVMVILSQKAKNEESFEEEELELKEWSKSTSRKYDRDEFV